ncbi:MAG: hypothetical protein CMH54_04290 [Myxococcales bacterium]|nr:hypothetical protein [Myxococcales bacterium]|tara:strand:+ start:536 stop:991 length:456 start_codon:yes stop_codon:yes gene_type:complete
MHIHRLLVLVVALGFLSIACGGDENHDGHDHGTTQTDTGNTGVDVATEDVATEDAGTEEDTTETVVSYALHVQPILETYCAGCHSDANMGGHNITSNYDDSFLDSTSCPGESMGACSVTLSIDGSMPPGNPKVTAEEIAIMQAWVDGGMQP